MPESRGDATRFLVAGCPRTGSSLIAMTLDLHPKVRCLGELFHPSLTERARNHHVSRDRDSVSFYRDGEDPIAFLERCVWQTTSVSAVGFKLFPSHANTGSTKGLFSRLHREYPDLSVIHAYRPNYLDVWVSLERASQTGLWQVPSARSRQIAADAKPVVINPDELEAYFSFMETSDEMIATFHHPGRYLRVTYSDLENRFQSALTRMWQFLGVDVVQLSPPLVKQNNESHSSFLLNYEELRRRFRSTRFAWFFSDAYSPPSS